MVKLSRGSVVADLQMQSDTSGRDSRNASALARCLREVRDWFLLSLFFLSFSLSLSLSLSLTHTHTLSLSISLSASLCLSLPLSLSPSLSLYLPLSRSCAHSR